MEQTKKVFPAIDVAKLAMAILVVIMHKPLFLQAYPKFLTGNVLGGAAVPFFFTVSAFLFFRKLDRETARPASVWLRYEKRLLLLYTLYTILYLPCIFVKNHTGHYAEITPGGIVGEAFVLVKNFFLSTSFVHFWYVNALIVCIAILFGLTRVVKNKWAVLGIGAAVYAVVALAYASPRLTAVTQIVPVVLYNALQKGLLCTCAGYFAAQTQDTVPKWEKALCPAAWVGMFVCGMLLFAQRKTPLAEHVLALESFVCAYATLRVCIGSGLRPSPVYGVLRRYSTLIYFWHLLLMVEGWRFLCGLVGIREPLAHPFLYFCVTLFLAVLESTAVILLQKKKRFDFLKYLY